MKLKFKDRIALFNTLAAALTLALVFIVLYRVISHTAYTHLDNDILLEKEEVISNLDWRKDTIIINKMPEWDEAEHSKVEVNPTFLQIVDTRGKVIFHSSNLLDDQFLYNPNISREIFYDSEISQQKIRLGQFPIPNEAGKVIGHLTIAISRQESYNILNSLVLVSLIAIPLVLIILYVASSIAADKAIEPVHELIRTASVINDSNIGTRLTMPGRKDELYELTQTINELLARIEVSMMQQKQFTSDASHEIRTPLAAIRGTLEVLIRKVREPRRYEEKIGEIILQVDRLDALLDQLLQLARIESGIAVAQKEAIRLQPLVAGMSDKWLESARTKSIELHVHIPDDAIVHGDRLFLELMLDNLVQNAIKYGKENGQVNLSWKDSKTLVVQDDGNGIALEHLPNIFNRFYRADESRSSAIRGSGLGLSIVKKLADLQSIVLHAESRPGEGSLFSLTFTS